MKMEKELLYYMDDLKGKYALVYSFGNICDSVELNYDPDNRINELKKSGTNKFEIYLTLKLEEYKEFKNNAHEIAKMVASGNDLKKVSFNA